jgi:hypothetical protein
MWAHDSTVGNRDAPCTVGSHSAAWRTYAVGTGSIARAPCTAGIENAAGMPIAHMDSDRTVAPAPCTVGTRQHAGTRGTPLLTRVVDP